MQRRSASENRTIERNFNRHNKVMTNNLYDAREAFRSPIKGKLIFPWQAELEVPPRFIN